MMRERPGVVRRLMPVFLLIIMIVLYKDNSSVLQEYRKGLCRIMDKKLRRAGSLALT